MTFGLTNRRPSSKWRMSTASLRCGLALPERADPRQYPHALCNPYERNRTTAALNGPGRMSARPTTAGHGPTLNGALPPRDRGSSCLTLMVIPGLVAVVPPVSVATLWSV